MQQSVQQLNTLTANDEYSRQICLGMNVMQTSYLVVLNALNQCLASQTRTKTYAGSIKHVHFMKILKKQIKQILQHQFTDFVRGQIIKFLT